MDRQSSFTKPLAQKYDEDLKHLERGFRPMLIVLKILGLLPLTIRPACSGSGELESAASEKAESEPQPQPQPPLIFQHKWTSWVSIFSLGLFIAYIGESAIFGPYMFYIAKARNPTNDKMALILETTFFTIQLLAAILTYIFANITASKVADAMNKLSVHVAYFVALDPQFGRIAIRRTNQLLVFWLTLLIMIVIFLFIFKSTEMSQYFTFWEHSKSIIQPALFVAYVQSASHFIPAYFYISICVMIGDSLLALGVSAATKRTSDEWLELYARFQDMNALCEQVNNIFGLYFISELVTLILTSVVHMYFVAFPHAGYHPGYLYAMPISVCFGYVGWMVTAGNYGNSYKEKVETCVDAMIQAASSNPACARDPQLLGPLMKLVSPPKGLHFSNFVTMDRSLPTMVNDNWQSTTANCNFVMRVRMPKIGRLVLASCLLIFRS